MARLSTGEARLSVEEFSWACGDLNVRDGNLQGGVQQAVPVRGYASSGIFGAKPSPPDLAMGGEIVSGPLG